MLPIVFARESTIYYETFVGAETEAEKFLRYYAENYVTQLTLAGKIENAHVVISDGEDLLRLQGVYGCLENIGVVRMEESLPSYGKSD